MSLFKTAYSLVLYVFLLSTTLVFSWNAGGATKSNKSLELSTDVNLDREQATDIEKALITTLIELTQGKIHNALSSVDQLIIKAPNFNLAHLIRGDLLMVLAQQDPVILSNSSGKVQSEIKNYREEARKRIQHYLAHNKKLGLPDAVWQLDHSIPFVVVVDTNKSRLYLYGNHHGHLNFIADYYATLGKNGIDKQIQGDKRTPIGVYTLGNRLKRELPDLYGEMAFPISYPNELDKHQNKTGSGIWLHGTPKNTYSRAPLDSDGCIVLANLELRTLAPSLHQGNTLIVVANDIKWNANSYNPQKIALNKAIEAWRSDWQSKNTERYLSHYSNKFFSKTTDFSGWATHKRIVQANNAKLKVSLSKISILRYPNRQYQMAMVLFEQDYRTEQLISRVMKRQYWIYENSRWRILYEGSA